MAGVHFRPVRRALGITAFGINGYTADAGERVIEEHDETGSGAGVHEELYLVIAGAATFELDGRETTAPAGTLVFVPDPKTRRGAIASEAGTTVVVIGGRPGAAPADLTVRALVRGRAGLRRGALRRGRADRAGRSPGASRQPDDALPAGLLHGPRRPARRGRGAPPRWRSRAIRRSGSGSRRTPISTRCATGPIGRAERGARGLSLVPCRSMPKGLLDELNPEQRRAVEAVQGAVLIVAGAGSGKTRVLTHRIAHLVRDHGVKPGRSSRSRSPTRPRRRCCERVDGLLGAAQPRHVGDDVPRRLRAHPARRGRAHRVPAGFTIYDQADQIRVVKDVLRGRARQGSEALSAARHPGPHLRRQEPADRPRAVRGRGVGLLRPDRRRRLRRRTSGASRRPARWTSTTCSAHAVKLLEDVPDVREKLAASSST